MKKKLAAQDIIKRFHLKPHPREGGFFVETYRSADALAKHTLPTHYDGPRSVCTCIYYMLTDTSFSEIHRLRGDEIFHFYFGDPVEMLNLNPDGSGKVIRLGTDLEAGEVPQVVVPGGVWQGSRLIDGGDVALMGCTMAPGFDYGDYEPGPREELTIKYPDFQYLIRELTHG